MHVSISLFVKNTENFKECLVFQTQIFQFNTYKRKWKMMGKSPENKFVILLENRSSQDFFFLF